MEVSTDFSMPSVSMMFLFISPGNVLLENISQYSVISHNFNYYLKCLLGHNFIS